MDYLECTYYLTGLHQARFQCELGECSGQPALGEETLARLQSLELDEERYGSDLFSALFPPGSPLRECYRQTEARLEGQGQGMRFRLYLEPDLPAAVRDLAWERIFDSERKIALARSPQSPFSRYPGGGSLPATLTRKARLLAAIAAPVNLAQYQLPPIDHDRFRARLEKCFERLRKMHLRGELLEKPVTPRALGDRLARGIHVLHLVAHGIPSHWGGAGLILEDPQKLAELVDEKVLSDVFLTSRERRLVVLMACHSGAAELAARLALRGLAAVIAMRRDISVEAANLFTDVFYSRLAESGQVDVAANRARLALFLDGRTRAHWSDPVLSMRLKNGRPWKRLGRVLVILIRVSLCLVALLPVLVLYWALVVGPLHTPVPQASARKPGIPTAPSSPRTLPQETPAISTPGFRGSTPAAPPERKTPARPEPSPDEAPSHPVGPDLDGLRARIRDAESYAAAGGSGNLEKSLRIYREIARDLSPVLDPGLLRLAQEQDQQGHTTDAIRLYRQLLNAYLQAFSSSTRRIDP